MSTKEQIQKLFSSLPTNEQNTLLKELNNYHKKGTTAELKETLGKNKNNWDLHTSF
ncbi:MAG: hypothetical protein ACUZ8I_16675 [Candidatus Scalindua sp.]